VDRALRSVNEMATAHSAEFAGMEQQEDEEGAKPDGLPAEPRKPFTSASASWAMAAKSMNKKQQGPGVSGGALPALATSPCKYFVLMPCV